MVSPGTSVGEEYSAKAIGRLRATSCRLGPLSRTNQRTGQWSHPTVLFILLLAKRLFQTVNLCDELIDPNTVSL